jgi:hypothetical protein
VGSTARPLHDAGTAFIHSTIACGGQKIGGAVTAVYDPLTDARHLVFREELEMSDTEVLQARIDVLEAALADYIVRYGLTEAGRKAMIRVNRSIVGQSSCSST